jgi:hypothetical protein
MTHATSKRRGHGEDSLYWDEPRNRYIGAVDLGLSPAGTRTRKKVSGKVKVEVPTSFEDWLAHGDDGLSERTVTL